MPSVEPVRIIAGIETNLMCYRHLQLGINAFSRVHPSWRVRYCRTTDEYLSLVASSPTAGLILGPINPENFPMAKAAIAMVGPTIGLCGCHREDGFDGLPEVEVDDPGVGAMAAAYFLEKGYRHFAYVNVAHAWATYRAEGFADTLRRAGHTVDVFTQDWASSTFVREAATGGSDKRLGNWLEMQPKPLAVLVCNDLRAQEVVQTCHDHGLHVPDEVAVLGVDDDDLCCALSDPPLSSVAIPWQRIGYFAAELLDRLIRGEPVAADVYRVAPVGVVERDSTGGTAVEDSDLRRAVRFIRANAHKLISVDDVVAFTDAITRRQLERRFRKLLNTTPLQEIQRAHFARAMMLLSGTQLSVHDVAMSSGFAESDWFVRAFKRKFNESPASYRRRNSGPSNPGNPPPIEAKSKSQST